MNPNKYEDRHKKWGFYFLGEGLALSLAGASGPLTHTDGTGNLIFGIGMGIRASSHYVMRAESLPPRKNCLSRGKDWLVEKLNEIDLSPTPQPIPVHANFEYSPNIEEYLMR